MPNVCVVCRKSSYKAQNLSFFGFPKDDKLRKQWMEALNLTLENKPISHLKVCSKHFSDKQYFTFSARSKLKSGAVPQLNLHYEEEISKSANQEPLIKAPLPAIPLVRDPLLDEPLEEGPLIKRERIEITIMEEPSNPVSTSSNIMILPSNPQIKLKKQNSPHFSVERFMVSDQDISFYTAMPSFKALLELFNLVYEADKDNKQGAIEGDRLCPKRCRPHKIKPLDNLFITLIRLRRGYELTHLAHLFDISSSNVSRIVSSWVGHLYKKLKSANLWQRGDVLKANAPSAYKEKYPNAIGNLACFEFGIETPTHSTATNALYKGATSLTGLIMTNPNGAIIFASPVFTTSADSPSDKKILNDSGFLELLKGKLASGEVQGDDVIVLTEIGFSVSQLLEDTDISTNSIPMYKTIGLRFGDAELQLKAKNGFSGIHVRQAIRRIKMFKFLQQPVPIRCLEYINEIFTVCVLLTNFFMPKNSGTINKK